jgi:hypothetical protein
MIISTKEPELNLYLSLIVWCIELKIRRLKVKNPWEEGDTKPNACSMQMLKFSVCF